MQLITSSSSLILIMLAVLSACQQTDKRETIESSETNLVMKSSIVEQEARQLRHVVLFKFKEDADQAAIDKAVAAFEALPAKIPQIKEFEWGTNNSPEGLNKGLTHCFLLTFESEEDRAIYLPHPDHKAFGALLGDILEDVTVVDYWTN